MLAYAVVLHQTRDKIVTSFAVVPYRNYLTEVKNLGLRPAYKSLKTRREAQEAGRKHVGKVYEEPKADAQHEPE